MAQFEGFEGLHTGISVTTVESEGGSIVIPDAGALFSADFVRVGEDLWLQATDGSLIIVEDYFAHGELAPLYSPEGAVLAPEVVAALVGPLAPGQVADLQIAQAAEPIGQVETLTGSATATRATGETVTLTVGDPVFQGDVVETGSGADLGITLVDGTVFSISANARMILDQLIYDPDGANNSMLLNLVQGTFVFITGEVAETGEVRVGTPVADLGIRGTSPLVKILNCLDAAYAGACGQLTVIVEDGATTFSIVNDPDGTLGSYTGYEKFTDNVKFFVDDTSTTLFVNSTTSPVQTIPKSPAEIAEDQDLADQAHAVYGISQERQQRESPDRDSDEGERGEIQADDIQQAAATEEGTTGDSGEGAADGDATDGDADDGGLDFGDAADPDTPDSADPSTTGADGTQPSGSATLETGASPLNTNSSGSSFGGGLDPQTVNNSFAASSSFAGETPVSEEASTADSSSSASEAGDPLAESQEDQSAPTDGDDAPIAGDPEIDDTDTEPPPPEPEPPIDPPDAPPPPPLNLDFSIGSDVAVISEEGEESVTYTVTLSGVIRFRVVRARR
jgi:hypothetical protein